MCIVVKGLGFIGVLFFWVLETRMQQMFLNLQPDRPVRGGGMTNFGRGRVFKHRLHDILRVVRFQAQKGRRASSFATFSS